MVAPRAVRKPPGGGFDFNSQEVSDFAKNVAAACMVSARIYAKNFKKEYEGKIKEIELQCTVAEAAAANLQQTQEELEAMVETLQNQCLYYHDLAAEVMGSFTSTSTSV